MFGKKMAKVVTVLAFVLAATAALAAAPVVYLDNYAEFGGVVNADGGVGFAPLSKAGTFKAGVLVYDGTVEGGVTLTADTEFPAGSYFSAYYMKYKVEYEEETSDVIVKAPEDLTDELVTRLSDPQNYTREDGHSMVAVAVQAKKLFTVDASVTVDCADGNGLAGHTVKAVGEQMTLRFDLTPPKVDMNSLDDLGKVSQGIQMENSDFATGVEESDWGKAKATQAFSVARDSKIVLSKDGKRVYSVYENEAFFFIEETKFADSVYTTSEEYLRRLAAPRSEVKSGVYQDGNVWLSLTWLGTTMTYTPATKGQDGQIQAQGLDVQAENSMFSVEENSDGTVTCKWSGGPAGAMTVTHGPSFGKGSSRHDGGNGGGGGGGCNASGLGFAPLALVGMLFARKRSVR